MKTKETQKQEKNENTKHEENDTSIIDNKVSSKSQRLHPSASDKGIKFTL